jgi:hypothetical protein
MASHVEAKEELDLLFGEPRLPDSAVLVVEWNVRACWNRLNAVGGISSDIDTRDLPWANA